MPADLWDNYDPERDLRQQLDAVCEQIDEYSRYSTSVITAVMLLAGYHQHHGAWRRRLVHQHNDTVSG